MSSGYPYFLPYPPPDQRKMVSLCFSSQYLTNDIKGHLIIELYGGMEYTGCFFTGPPPKKLRYGKPRLGEVTCI